MEINEITKMIIGAAITVHKELGPGLLESVYECCLIEELQQTGLKVQSQVPVPILYKGEVLNKNFILDLLVENCVVVELKAIEDLCPVHEAQLLTYLKLSGKKIGLLINFNVVTLKDGIRRRVNNL